MQEYLSEIPKDVADRIFEETIFPSISINTYQSQIQSAVIIGGQPGSGKSVFASLILQNDSNNVFINGDDFRAYHPNYINLLNENELEAADATQELVNYWIERAISLCIELKLNFLIEGTMRTKKAPLKTASLAKSSGYNICGAIVSTPSDISLASTVYRFEEAKKNGGIARYTKKESHDEAYRMIPETILELINSNLFDSFIIGKRKLDNFEILKFDYNEFNEILNQFTEGRERYLESEEEEFVNSLIPYKEHLNEILNMKY